MEERQADGLLEGRLKTAYHSTARVSGITHSVYRYRIVDYLGAQGVDRSVVRVLDALLWGSHKASWVAPLAPVIARWRLESSR